MTIHEYSNHSNVGIIDITNIKGGISSLKPKKLNHYLGAKANENRSNVDPRNDNTCELEKPLPTRSAKGDVWSIIIDFSSENLFFLQNAINKTHFFPKKEKNTPLFLSGKKQKKIMSAVCCFRAHSSPGGYSKE